MVVNTIIQELLSVGFSEYEARAYISLLKSKEPMTAYQLAKDSGIPTSKIYEVIIRLTDKEILISLEDSGKKKYTALDTEVFLGNYRAKLESSLDRIKTEFDSFKTESEAAMIWNFRNYDVLLAKAKKMVLGTKKNILLSVWKEELALLADSLKKVENAGIAIAIVHFGRPEFRIGQLFYHPIEDTLYKEKGGRSFLLISDEQEALMGTVYEHGYVDGAWSRNKGFISLAGDYIRHDIYNMKIIERFNPLLLERFGENYFKLRDIFHNEEVSQ